MSNIGIHGAGAGAAGPQATVAISQTGTDNNVDVASLPNEGQQTMANSISVAVASDQSAIPVSATDLDIRNLVFATDKVDASGSTGVGVTGTFFQATQPVSIAATVQVDVTDEAARDLGKVDIASLDQYTPVSGRLPVDGSGVTQPVSGTVTANAGTNLNTSALALETTQAAQLSRADTFKTRSDTFTSTTSGITIDASLSPVSAFGIQVKMTGVVTSWDVRIEGSLNNSEFTTILTHTNVTGDGVTMWTGALEAPTLYFRSRAAGLVLGGGTNIVVTILGQN